MDGVNAHVFPHGFNRSCVDPELGNPDSPYAYIEDMEKLKPEQKAKGPYFAGLDLGKQVDYSVLVVVQKGLNGDIRLVHKRQLPLGTNYPEVIGYIARAQQVFGFEALHVDKGCIGDAVIDELNNIHLPAVEGVFFTDTEKENMLNNLKLLMEKKRLKIAGDDKTLIAQLNEQIYEYLQPKTAQERIHLKFRHPHRKTRRPTYGIGTRLQSSIKCGTARHRRHNASKIKQKLHQVMPNCESKSICFLICNMRSQSELK